MALYISNWLGTSLEYPENLGGLAEEYAYDTAGWLDLYSLDENSISYDETTHLLTASLYNGATLEAHVKISGDMVSISDVILDSPYYPSSHFEYLGTLKVNLNSGAVSGYITHISATIDDLTLSMDGRVDYGSGTGTITHIYYDFGDGFVDLKGKITFDGVGLTGYITSFSFEDAGGRTGAFTGIKLSLSTLDAYTSFDDFVAGTLSGNDVMKGTTGDDILQGFAGNDTLNGGLGNDSLYGGLGNDKLDGGDGIDILSAGGGIDSIVGGKGTDTLILDGNHGDYAYARPTATSFTITEKANPLNVITVSTVEFIEFNDGTKSIAETLENSPTKFDDYFDGNAWDDNIAMAGGLGDDTYVVHNDSDTILENANQGADTVMAKLDGYELADHVENLTIDAGVTDAQAGGELGYGTVEAFGNALNNAMIGNAADNLLDGGAGADTMTGGEGDDQYYVDNKGDKVTELAGQGNDTVYTTFASHTLAANVENLIYEGSAAFTGTGNALDNQITGGNGNDKLTGGDGNDTFTYTGGVDTIYGGAGQDTLVLDGLYEDYTIDSFGTKLVVKSHDTGLVQITAYDLEDVVFADRGRASIFKDLFLNQPSIYADYFDDDVPMAGGLGDDVYVIDSIDDQVTELAKQGADTILTDLNGYTLLSHFEKLTLTGSDDIDGNGNELANVITGNGGDNILDGKLGADKMLGGEGNDTYYVDKGDVVTELADQGNDTVHTALSSYTLTAHVEKLIYEGIATFKGTGNALDNQITGGIGKDALTGGLGNDTLTGGLGNDVLDGGSGNDIFVFDTAPGVTNIDTIKGFLSGTDKIQLDTAIFSALTSGTLVAAEFASGAGAAAVASNADQHIVYDTATGNLFYDADGNGAEAAIKFATLTGRPALQASDFSVVTVL